MPLFIRLAVIGWSLVAATASFAAPPATKLAPHPDAVANIHPPGEIDKPDLVTARRTADGKMDGTQIHMLSFLGTQWGSGTPRFTTDQVVAYTKKVRDFGGSVTWDVPVEIDGTITQPFLDQLAALGNAFPKK